MSNVSIASVTVMSLQLSRSSQAWRRVADARALGARLGLGLALASVTASHAFAAGGGGTAGGGSTAVSTNLDVGTVLTNVLTVITGTMGTSLAALGIIACGLAWMFGRASLGMIAGVVGGIMIVFCASSIAKALVGGG